MWPIVIGAVVLILIGVVSFALYNGLVRARNLVDEAKAQEATQLQRRHDLIPNLVSTVKGYAKHEASVLESIAEERAKAQRPTEDSSVDELKQAERQIGSMLSRINAVAENYPDLKASANFQQLQEELSTTENKVAFARQNYNDRVYDYNSKIQTVPSNIIAKLFSFEKRDMFDVESEEARKVPQVSFE